MSNASSNNNTAAAVRQALDKDAQQNLPEAYLAYLNAMESIAATLRGSTAVDPSRNVPQLFRMMHQCAERAQHLHDHHADQVIPAAYAAWQHSRKPSVHQPLSRSSSSSSLSPPSTPPPSSKPSSSPSSIASSSSSQSIEQLRRRQAELHSEGMRLQQAISSTHTKPRHTMVLMRRYAENVALQNMQQRMITEAEEAAAAAAAPSSSSSSSMLPGGKNNNYASGGWSLGRQIRRLVLQRNDTWQIFVEEHFHINQQNPAVLAEERRRIRQIEEKEDPQEVDRLSQEMVAWMAQSCSQHALAQIIALFADRLSRDYPSSNTEEHPSSIALLNKARADISAFTDKLLGTIFRYYPVLDTDAGERALDAAVTEGVLEQAFPTVLLPLYRQGAQEAETGLQRSLTMLREAEPERFGVGEQFRRSVDVGRTVQVMETLMEMRTPRGKLKVLGRITSQICEDAMAGVRAMEGDEAADNLIIGADDMVPLLAYALTRSQARDLWPQVRYVEDFASDAVLRGDGGYGLATLSTVMGVCEAIAQEGKEADPTE